MTRSRKSQKPTRPFRSVASQMTFDHRVAVEEAAAAELRGDWRHAYERHRSVPMFRQSRHGQDLGLLADLGDEAPDWLVTRFVVGLAHRLEMHGQPRRSGRVLQRVVPVIYPDAIPMVDIGCEHPEQVGPSIFGADWVVRQADIYDLGGLEDLLATPAAAGALARAPLAEQWRLSDVIGYTVLGADAGVLRVAEAVSGEVVELLDLGLTEQVEVGTHVLGRVVPTAVDPGLLFDGRPVPVDEGTARLVADDAGRWLRIVAERRLSNDLPSGFSHLGDTSLSADLPRWSWGSLLGHPVDDLPGHPATHAAEALEAALLLATDPVAVRRQRQLVSELLLDEALDERVLARFATPAHRRAWEVLAEALPPYAARRCHEALWLLDASTPGEGLAG